MKYFLLFLIFICTSLSVSSQVMVDFDIKTKNYANNKNEAGVTVKVYEGANLLKTLTSPANGRVVFQMPAEKQYKIEVSKAGKVTRFFAVNAKGIDLELIQGAGNPFVEVEVSIFDKTPNADWSYVENNSITEFKFSGTDRLSFNQATATNMVNKIEAIMAEAEKPKFDKAAFNKLIKEADAFAAQSKYQDAITKYEAALQMNHTDEYANKELIRMEDLLAAEKKQAALSNQADAEYNNLIKAAETLKAQKKYKEAIAKFEEAYTKKKEDYPLTQIDEIKELIYKQEREAENQKKYDDLMKAGEILVKQKSYRSARDTYEQASKLKLSETLPKTKMAELDKLIEGQQALIDKKKNYDDAIAAADQFFKDEKWAESKAKYEEAIKIESASTYPSERIKLIQIELDKIEKEKQRLAQIEKLLAEGQKALTDKQLDPAKLKYEEVLKLDAENATAKAKLTEIQGLLDAAKKNAELEANFKKLVDEGDALVKTSKWEDAVAKYDAAIKLKADPTVDAKITDAKKKLADSKNAAEKKANYDAAMLAGEKLMSEKKWDEAKAKFNEAIGFDETQTAPKEKIKLIDAELAKIADANQKKEAFDKLMKEANDLYAATKLTEAKAKVNEALVLDKMSQPAKDLLAKIDADIKAQGDAAAKKDKFDAAIKAGDDLVAQNKLKEAKAKYTEAGVIDGTSAIPPAKIKEVDDIIAAESDAAAKKALNEKFDAAMKAGSDLALANKLEEAKKKYEEAKGIDGTRPEPQAKIDEINAKLKAIADAKQAKEAFDALIIDGDKLLTENKFDEAKAKFTEAQSLDGASTIPPAKLKLVEEKRAAQNDAAAKKALQEKFDAAMKAGDDLLATEKLEAARAKFVEAQGIDGTRPEPKAKIDAIDVKLKALADAKNTSEKFNALITEGDNLLSAAKFDEAKAKYVEAGNLDKTSSVPPAKIKALEEQRAAQSDAAAKKALQERYTAAMKAGDDFMSAEKWQEARAKFVEAKGIDGSRTEPQTKIDEIDVKLKAIADAQSANQKFDAAIKAGDDLLAQSKYDEAKAKYAEAANLDKNSPIPPAKIKAIDDQIAAQKEAKENEFKQLKKAGFDAFDAKSWDLAKTKLNEALKIHADQEITDKLKAIEDKINAENATASKDQEYAKRISDAKEFESQGKLDEAISSYEAALKIKENEPIPAQKIAELKALKEKNKAQAAIDEKYNAEMAKGNKALSDKMYLEAIQFYNEANKIKSEEQEPVDKANEARRLEKEKNSDEDRNYQKVLEAGQKAMDSKDWTKATEYYTRAIGLAESLKKDKSVPEGKLAEIENLKNAEASEKEKLAEINKAYQAKMTLANNEKSKANYESAIALYEEAKKIKSSETEPDLKIQEINDLLNQAKNKEAEQAQFDAEMAKGQKAFDAKEYPAALSAYTAALNIRSSDATALAKLNEVKQIMDNLANANKEKANKAAYDALILEADNLFNAQNWSKAQGKYEEALTKIKGDAYATKQAATCKDKLNANKEKEANYQKWISQGDVNFQASDYRAAKTSYNEALKIKQNDTYALSQLTKIEEILNPKIVQNGPLPNLGIPSNNSIMDGDALLRKAEEERKNRRNTKVLKKGNDISIDQNERTLDKNKEILSNANEILNIEIKRSETQISDDASRQLMVEEVNKTSVKAEDLSVESGIYDYNDQLNLSEKMIVTRGENEVTYLESENVYRENTLVVDAFQTVATNQYTEIDTKKTGTIYETDHKIDESRKIIRDATIKSDDRRTADVETIKIVDKKVNDDEMVAFDKNMLKNLASKDEINTQEIKNTGVVEQEKAMNASNIELVTKVDLKVTVVSQENSMSDDAQRQLTKDKIDVSDVNSEKKTTENSQNPNNNGENMKNISSAVNDGDMNQNKAQTEKNLASRALIEKYAKNEMKFDEKVANALGEQYAEGVTQESFNQLDEDGLLVAVITRRIVVKNGYGAIYVRTQNLYNTTYSKNGNPSSEFIWQKETEDASLSKNY